MHFSQRYCLNGISKGRIWETKSYLLDKIGQKTWEKEFKIFKVKAAESTPDGGCILGADGSVKKRIVFTSLWGAHPLTIQADVDGGYLINGK